LTELSKKLNFLANRSAPGASGIGTTMPRIGVVDGALGEVERMGALASLFPHVAFESVGPAWPERVPARFDILVVAVESSSIIEMDDAVRRLKSMPVSTRVLVVLRNADVINTRRLAREGAADVLPAPASEPAFALSLERLLTRDSSHPAAGRRSGQIVALLKAGGGVGATALGVQVGAMLSTRAGDSARICLADLDPQFGIAALYLDIREPMTVADCLAAGPALADTNLAEALVKHKSGVSLLGAPREMMPLEAITPPLMDTLMAGLRRDFALSILDMPSAWTTWTNRALQLVDRIVLVTQLSIPHVHLVRRQLDVLATQKLDDRPLILVCNAPSSEQQASISIKAAERAIGKAFDIVIPEDRGVMSAAINQGLEISAVRRGTKLEKAVGQLADAMGADALVGAASPQIGRR
jgi:pilus assembly protein CpaE